MLVFSVTLIWSHVAVVLKDLIVETGIPLIEVNVTTVEPPNNGHVGDECFVHCSEVVPSLEVTVDLSIKCHYDLITYCSGVGVVIV